MMMTDTLACSVIIPTYNRAELLRFTLDSLVRQTLRSDRFEVLIIDDGSSDRTADMATGYQGVLNLRYFFQEDEGWRVAKARNVGIANARSEVCVFLDSGVVAHSGCLAAHVESHVATPERVAVIGYVYGFDVDDEDAPLIDATIDATDPDATIKALRENGQWPDIRDLFYDKYTDDFHDLVPAPWLPYWTCDVSANTTQLRAVGMFDEAFRSWGAEDTDLAYRLFLDGARFVLNRDAAAIHVPHDKSFAKNMGDAAANTRYMAAKYGTPIIELLTEDPAIPFFEMNDVIVDRGLPDCADYLARKRCEPVKDDITPTLSVVIPTYNRCELLKRLLRQLTEQTVPAHEFEVIVADDGSADATKDVVNSFGDLLRIKYHFQEDLGFRAALARNSGARIAEAPLLVFVDCGEFVGPGFVAGHLAAHAGERGRAVIGAVHGYNPATGEPMPELRRLMDERPPADIVREYGDDPAFRDDRHEFLAPVGFDLNGLDTPWQFFWTGNCSVRTEDFWAAGGFDEGFLGWGLEDLEFGYRLFRSGLPFSFTTDAWTIEYPHSRDIGDNAEKVADNITRFLAKHPDPVIEFFWILLTRDLLLDGWDTYREELAAVSRATRELSVVDELARGTSDLQKGRVAIIGAGAAAPDSLPAADLIDFDRELLDRALADGRHTGHHAIGLRTPLADQSVDTVVITSRLAALWSRWGDRILAEAHRIGSDVRVLFAHAEEGV